MKKKKHNPNTIANNKKASFDYFFEDKLEAGLALHGWEIKSIREGKVQLSDSHVIFKNNEAWLLGAQIQPLSFVGSYVGADASRTRKLLLNRKEISKLIGAKERQGYTIVATRMYWKGNLVKLEIALAKGKKSFDKRQVIKEREWNIKKAKNLKLGSWQD